MEENKVTVNSDSTTSEVKDISTPVGSAEGTESETTVKETLRHQLRLYDDRTLAYKAFRSANAGRVKRPDSEFSIYIDHALYALDVLNAAVSNYGFDGVEFEICGVSYSAQDYLNVLGSQFSKVVLKTGVSITGSLNSAQFVNLKADDDLVTMRQRPQELRDDLIMLASYAGVDNWNGKWNEEADANRGQILSEVNLYNVETGYCRNSETLPYVLIEEVDSLFGKAIYSSLYSDAKFALLREVFRFEKSK